MKKGILLGNTNYNLYAWTSSEQGLRSPQYFFPDYKIGIRRKLTTPTK